MGRKGNWGFLLFVAACAAMMLLSALHARADEETVWLTTGMWSRHGVNSAAAGVDISSFRENNTGIGIEYDYSVDSSVHVGTYMNSIDKRTNYMAVSWQPLQYNSWRAGVMGGLATGYVDYLPAVPMGSLIASYNGDRAGFNIVWLPTVVVAVQLKVKVW